MAIKVGDTVKVDRKKYTVIAVYGGGAVLNVEGADGTTRKVTAQQLETEPSGATGSARRTGPGPGGGGESEDEGEGKVKELVNLKATIKTKETILNERP